MVRPQRTAVTAEAMQRAGVLREVPLLQALAALGAHCKEDRSYAPTHNKTARRFHVSVSGQDFELLIRDKKWFDIRADTGGGGTIDLTMHLFSESFTRAVQRLNRVI